jgi:hypothetical protein
MQHKPNRRIGACLIAVLALSCLIAPADGRLQYKSIIRDIKDPTDVEKKVQAAIKKTSCKHCHPGAKKSIRSAYGMKIHDGLGGGDQKKYKFDKKFWTKKDGAYSPEAIKKLRDAIKFASKPKGT